MYVLAIHIIALKNGDDGVGKMYVTLSGSSRTDIVRCDIQLASSSHTEMEFN